MEIDEQMARHSSVIQNNYYGGVTTVINIKLTKDQVDVLCPGNQIGNAINNLLNPQKVEDHGQQQ